MTNDRNLHLTVVVAKPPVVASEAKQRQEGLLFNTEFHRVTQS